MRTQSVIRSCTALVVVFSLGLALGQPRLAQAHARLVRSNPPSKAEMAQAPESVELWFNELLDDGFNSVEVFAAGEPDAKQRTNLVKGKAKLDPKDRTHLIVQMPRLSPGEYTVEWRVLSRDGHSAPGRFTFRVKDSRS
jgi:methionine-rich copper-binding protein CopC